MVDKLVVLFVVIVAASFGLTAIWIFACILADILQPKLRIRWRGAHGFAAPGHQPEGELDATSPILYEQQVRRG